MFGSTVSSEIYMIVLVYIIHMTQSHDKVTEHRWRVNLTTRLLVCPTQYSCIVWVLPRPKYECFWTVRGQKISLTQELFLWAILCSSGLYINQCKINRRNCWQLLQCLGSIAAPWMVVFITKAKRYWSRVLFCFVGFFFGLPYFCFTFHFFSFDFSANVLNLTLMGRQWYPFLHCAAWFVFQFDFVDLFYLMLMAGPLLTVLLQWDHSGWWKSQKVWSTSMSIASLRQACWRKTGNLNSERPSVWWGLNWQPSFLLWGHSANHWTLKRCSVVLFSSSVI